MLAHIDGSIVSIVLSRSVIAPRGIPVAIVKEIVTTRYERHIRIMRMIPAGVVPFRMIRTEHFILLPLPVLASFNPTVLVECDRLNLLRFRLRAEVRMLRFDLLH